MDALGQLYEDGNGVEKDLELAAQWYYEAIEYGSAEAELNYARILLLRGDEQAGFWYLEQAAMHGNQSATEYLQMNSEKQDSDIS
jgi:TPR repeat protein